MKTECISVSLDIYKVYNYIYFIMLLMSIFSNANVRIKRKQDVTFVEPLKLAEFHYDIDKYFF